MTSAPIPPDVAAYLQAAAVELATEQGFQPDSESALAPWMEENRQEIGRRALAAMNRLREKLMGNPEMMELACNVLSWQVYKSIPAGPQKWNPRYLAYAEATGCAPENVKKRDGSNAGFICWCSQNPAVPA